MNRRKLVQSVVAVGLLSGLPAAGTELPKTPRDYTGPFYPKGPRNRRSDLIVGEPRAEVLHLAGRILTPDGSPLTGVLVDIWQADPNGRYKHPRDRGQDSLMEEFLYWGEASTDAEARFGFRTYLPGRYSARPAQHIHYKVWRDRRELLTSQIYFDELGGARGLARSERAAALQTVSLERIDEETFAAELQIVI
ncbi:MAG: protocatechuate 3,4-dioxygenase [Gammaproteobacteria bacterium]|nr:protocatechuate 3,4-dioxygenase [Gammaproteobacteria bacterium]